MKPFLLVLLAAAAFRFGATSHRAGNDTDALIARGLFPLGRHNPPLTILSETVRVSLGPDSVTTTRVYLIRNDGRSAVVKLATICGTNQLDADCGKVRMGAVVPPSRRAIGYLVDSGGYVAIKPKTRRAIEECLKNLDGNVCGHEWTTYTTRMRADESVSVSLRYQTPYDSRYWIESVVDPLYLYTEKFWRGDSVPEVTLWAEVPGGKFSLTSWTPTGQYAQYSRPPTGESDGAIYWRVNGYRPVKKQYSYTFQLLHPFAMDHVLIRAAYDSAMAQTGSARRSGP